MPPKQSVNYWLSTLVGINVLLCGWNLNKTVQNSEAIARIEARQIAHESKSVASVTKQLAP